MSKKFFNQRAEEWDEMVDHNEVKIEEVINLLPDYKEPKILDVGSGTGVLIPFLKERYGRAAEITELDFAEEMIKVAQKKYQDYDNIEYLVGDIYTYSLPQNYYDLIVCYSVFPHFADKPQILKRFKSLLADDGLVVIFHSQSREEINQLHQDKGEEVKSDHLPPAEEVREWAEELNYSVEQIIDNDEMYLIILV